MWKLTNSSVKFTNLGDALFAKSGLFGRYFPIAPSEVYGKCLSEFNDKFAMPFFDQKIWQDLSAYVKKSVSSYNPFITISFKKVVSCLLKTCRTCSPKRFLQPVEKSFVCVGNFKNTSIVAIFIAISWLVFEFTGVKASLPVYYPCKICEMDWVVCFWLVVESMFVVYIVEFRHNTSMCLPKSIHKSYINYQADRLKRLDICDNQIKRQSGLPRKPEEIGRNDRSPRDGSNNSQEGVLAWVSERLAVAMRLEDLAHVKSSLMDLNLLEAA